MWCGTRAPTPLVKGGGRGSPLQLLDCALLNTGSASCVHTRSHAFTWAHHMLTSRAHWCSQPHARAIHVVHMRAHACLHNEIRVSAVHGRTCVHTYVLTYRHMCLHEHRCVHPRAHTRSHTRTPQVCPSICGVGNSGQRLVSIPCLLAWPCLPRHTGLPHLGTQPACPSSSHAARWPPFRMGCLAGQGSSSQRDTLERGLRGSGRALGHAGRGPGSWNWGQGLRA